MGEMTGEMKNAGSLYLKGSTPSDGRDGPLFVNNPSLSVNNASLISNNPALFALNPILFCARCSLTGNYLFPPWEQNIPSLGIKHSHRGNIVRTIKSSSFSCLSYLQQIVIEYLLGFGSIRKMIVVSTRMAK